MKYRSNRSGLTLIELIIIVVILAIVAGIAWFAITSLRNSKELATQEAKAFAAEMKLQAESISCAERDTDSDGYVSCTISIQDGGRRRLEAIECAAKWTLNDGCRMQKAFRSE